MRLLRPTAVRYRSQANWCFLVAFARRRNGIDGEAVLRFRHHDPVISFGRLAGNIPLPHVRKHPFGLAFERVAEAAAAGGVETEDIALAQRVVRVAGGQAFGGCAVRIDHDIAGATVAASGAAVRRDHVLHGADGEPRVLKVEILAPQAEAAPVAAGAAGIRDEVEPQEAGRELGFDDLDRRDAGVALIDRDAGGAVPAAAGAGAARHDLVLDVVAARIGTAPTQND